MTLAHCHNLEEVREQINQIDEKIVELLTERVQYVRFAVKFKKTEHDVKAPERVKQVITRVRAMAKTHGMDPAAVEKIYRTLIEAMIKEEMKAAPRTSG